MIKLPVYGIMVDVDLENPEAGSILSPAEMFDVCPKCSQRDCIWSCEAYLEGNGYGDLSDETDETVRNRLQANGATDAILSLILAHACSGVDIESPAYLEGIETAFDAIENNA